MREFKKITPYARDQNNNMYSILIYHRDLSKIKARIKTLDKKLKYRIVKLNQNNFIIYYLYVSSGVKTNRKDLIRI